MITADTSDNSKYRRPESWLECDCVIYSPTITVGIDFSYEYFDRKYVLAPESGRGCVALDLIQMAARVRKVTDPEVMLYMPRRYSTRKLPDSVEALKKDIQRTMRINSYNSRNSRMTKENDVREKYSSVTKVSFLLNGDVQRQLKNDALTELQLMNMVEQNCSEMYYEGLLRYFFEKQGYVFNTDLILPVDEVSDDYKDDIKEIKTKMTNDRQQAIIEQNQKDEDDLYNSVLSVQRGVANEEDKIASEVYYVRKDFDEKPKDLDILEVMGSHTQYKNGQFTRDMIHYPADIRKTIMSLPLNKTIERTPRVNQLEQRVAKLLVVNEIMEVLGLSLNDCITTKQTVLPLQKMDELHEWLSYKNGPMNISNFERLSRPFHKDRSKIQNDPKHSIRFISDILNSWSKSSLTLMTERRRQGKNKQIRVPTGLRFECRLSTKLLQTMKTRDWSFPLAM